MTNVTGSPVQFQVLYMGQVIETEVTELNGGGFPAGVNTGNPSDAEVIYPPAEPNPDVEGAQLTIPQDFLVSYVPVPSDPLHAALFFADGTYVGPLLDAPVPGGTDAPADVILTELIHNAETLSGAALIATDNAIEDTTITVNGQTYTGQQATSVEFNSDGILVYAATPSASTSDLNSTELATLLANEVDAKEASHLEVWASNHLPADGLTPVETDPIAGDTITSLIKDAEGTNPQFLLLTGSGDTIDTTGIVGLHALILQGGSLTVTGTAQHPLNIFNDAGDVVLQDSGNDIIHSDGGYLNFSGNTGNDTIYADAEVLGNNGVDTYYITDGIVITGSLSTDTIIMSGGKDIYADGLNETVRQTGGSLFSNGAHVVDTEYGGVNEMGSGMDIDYLHGGVVSMGSGQGNEVIIEADDTHTPNADAVMGSGDNQVVKDYGTNTIIYGGYGTNDTLMNFGSGTTIHGGNGDYQTILDEGNGDTVYLGTGLNDIVRSSVANTTISDRGSNNATISATGGMDTLNLGQATETLHLASEWKQYHQYS
jgi:hypothetical protein